MRKDLLPLKRFPLYVGKFFPQGRISNMLDGNTSQSRTQYYPQIIFMPAVSDSVSDKWFHKNLVK